MTTLIIDVADLDTVKASLRAAFRGEPQGCRYTIQSEEALLTTLNPNRWASSRRSPVQGLWGWTRLRGASDGTLTASMLMQRRW
jgi:hypothetical protein